MKCLRYLLSFVEVDARRGAGRCHVKRYSVRSDRQDLEVSSMRAAFVPSYYLLECVFRFSKDSLWSGIDADVPASGRHAVVCKLLEAISSVCRLGPFADVLLSYVVTLDPIYIRVPQ